MTTETIDSGPEEDLSSLEKYIPARVDKMTAVFLLAAQLQHECPLVGGDFWSKPDINVSGETITISIMSWHGTTLDSDEGDKKAASMRTFRALASYFKPLDKKLNQYSGMYLERTYEFAGHTITLEIYPASGVCEKRETGETKTVQVEKVVRKASVKTVEEEVPVFEWHCPPVFADEVS